MDAVRITASKYGTYYVLQFYKDQIYYKEYKGDVNGTIVEWETALDLYE